jgi:hypothetical protein
MFVVYTTITTDQAEGLLYQYLSELETKLEKLPQDVSQLGEGVWFVTSVEALTFLSTLGQLSLGKPLQFHVKGLSPS